MATTLQNVTNVFDVPLGLIVRGRNTRTVEVKPDRFMEMVESFKRHGQMTPVEVWRRADGKFDLIFGYTRLSAAEHLGWDTVKVKVEDAPNKDPEKVRRLRGLAENLAREDLTPYDQANEFHSLKKEWDMSTQLIAQNVGRSTSYVNNLCRIVDSVEQCITDRWKKECNPKFGLGEDGKKLPGTFSVCTMEWLTGLAANVPRVDQENALKRALGLIKDGDREDHDDEDEDSGEARVPGGAKRPTMKGIKDAIADVVAWGKQNPGDYAMGLLDALKFASGKRKTIKGVTGTSKGKVEE